MVKKLTLAIDIGGTNIKLALVNRAGGIKSKKIFPAYSRQRKSLIKDLLFYIDDLLEKARLKKRDLLGIGIGLPGIVDTSHGLVHSLTNIPGFRNVALKKILERKLHRPVFLDNDVNLMALGEYYFGAGRGANNIICLTLGTGVGGGLIIEGKLYRGSSLSAGEIGHIPLNEDGHRCNCGGKACLETYIGNKYLVKEAVKKISKTSTCLSQINLTPEKITQAAKKGDKLAIQIWKETGQRLGTVLAGLVNLLNPEKIIIGGGLAQAGHFLFTPIRKTVNERAMNFPARKVKIVRARLGEEAGLIGAAVLVWLNKELAK